MLNKTLKGVRLVVGSGALVYTFCRQVATTVQVDKNVVAS